MFGRVPDEELDRIPMFASLPKRLRHEVASWSTPVRFAAGDVLITEGEVGREAFLLIEGTATVTRGGEELALLGAGALVGEQALLGDGRRNATVTASTDVEALVMSPREFASILRLPGVAGTVEQLAGARTPAA